MGRTTRTLKFLGVNLAVAVLGFLVGAFSLYVYSVWQGPPLQLWHTLELEEEFTAAKVGEVRTFGDVDMAKACGMVIM